jgi:hypothetical protein
MGRGEAFLSLNVKLMNLFIGLCKGDPALSPQFRDLGYKEHAIELRFQNADGDAVVPELVIASRRIHNTLLFEWKSGPNTEADQLRRYSRVTNADLSQRAMLDRAACATHDITLVGLDEYRERLVQGIDNGGFPFPVLIVTEAGLEKIRNQFSEPATDALFQNTLDVDWSRAPMSYFPLDGDSEDWEYAEHVLPLVLTQMSDGSPRIVAVELARQLVPLFDIANPDFRKQVRRKIVTVLDYAERHEFAQFLRRNKAYESRGGSPAWEVVDNPILNEPDKRLKHWRQMKSRQSRVIAHFHGDEVQGELPLEIEE